MLATGDVLWQQGWAERARHLFSGGEVTWTVEAGRGAADGPGLAGGSEQN